MTMLKKNQIVCLDHQNKSLYCEVIDVIESRDLCWVRPIMLVSLLDQNCLLKPKRGNVCDLRYSSDLFWNLKGFRPVFDTEYIEFVSKLEEYDWAKDKSHLARRQLRCFLEEIYQASIKNTVFANK
jgi:hypothetical protein